MQQFRSELLHGFEFKLMPMKVYNFVRKSFFILALSMTGFCVMSQDTALLKGQVTDDKGEPLIGVTVLVKDTPHVVITDIEGNYELNVPSDGILQISYVGFETAIIPYHGQSNLDVALKTDVQMMDEVVVVGYGVVNKKDLTGSVSVLSADDLSRQPVVRLEGALQAKVAGVFVNQNSGNPGEAFKVRIRGVNSFSGNNAPLYVIDGFLGADVQSINPSDIQSISVLKDASATALYGSQGANGVIIITTKMGDKDQAKIDLKYNHSISQLPSQWELLEGWEYMQVRNERLLAEGTAEANLPFSRSDILLAQANGSTNWQDEIFQTGNQHQVQFGASKGNFYLSGAAQTNKGLIKGTEYNRYNIRFTYTDHIFDPVKLFFSVSNGFEDRVNANTSDLVSTIESALGWPSNLPVIDPLTGDYYRNQAYGTLRPNPVFILNENKERALRNDFLANTYLEFDIIDGLKFKTQGALNLRGISSTSFDRVSPNEVANNPTNSSYGNNNKTTFNWQATQQLTYSRLYGIHDFNATALYELRSTKTREFSGAGSGLSTQDLGFFSSPVAEFQKNGSAKSNRELWSFFGRVNYTLDDTYLFTFNFRHDESSQLGEGFEGANFFGAAFAYQLTKLPFIQSIQAIDQLKLRVSAGQVGSQSVGFNQTEETVRYNRGYSYDGVSNQRGTILPSPVNPQLTWETTNQFDAGVDLRLWDGRVNLTADYYYKLTTGLIFSRPVPAYLGGGSVKVNSGEMENKGFDFAGSGFIVTQTDFSIETSANISFVRNKLVAIEGNNDFIVSGKNPRDEPDLQDNTHRNFVGRPVGLLWGLNYEGVYKSDEADQAARYNRSPGDAKYTDLDDNGSIDNADMMVIGDPNPDFIWGFITNVRYKNWSLNMVWSGVHGVDVFNSVKYLTYTGARDATNRDILNRWTPENEDSDIPGYSPTGVVFRQSNQWIEDGSYIKLRNITLNYDVPVASVPWMKAFSSLSLYVTAQNVLVFTDYSGFDPESLSSTGDRAGGFDEGGYPIPRTVIAGINIGF